MHQRIGTSSATSRRGDIVGGCHERSGQSRPTRLIANRAYRVRFAAGRHKKLGRPIGLYAELSRRRRRKPRPKRAVLNKARLVGSGIGSAAANVGASTM